MLLRQRMLCLVATRHRQPLCPRLVASVRQPAVLRLVADFAVLRPGPLCPRLVPAVVAVAAVRQTAALRLSWYLMLDLQ